MVTYHVLMPGLAYKVLPRSSRSTISLQRITLPQNPYHQCPLHNSPFGQVQNDPNISTMIRSCHRSLFVSASSALPVIRLGSHPRCQIFSLSTSFSSQKRERSHRRLKQVSKEDGGDNRHVLGIQNLAVISQQLQHKFCSNLPHIEFVRQIALACPIWQGHNIADIIDYPPSVLQDILTHFSTFSSVLVECLPEHSSSFSNVWPFLNRLNQCCKFVFVMIFVTLFLSLKQNFILTQSSFMSTISIKNKCKIKQTQNYKGCLEQKMYAFIMKPHGRLVHKG